MSKEEEILLHCARTKVNEKIKNKIIDLLNSDIDWDYLINLASHNRLMPLLIHNINFICPELIPDNFLVYFKKFFYDNATKNLLFETELIKIMKLLESNGIKSITYKGPVLSQIAYGNITLRQFRDVDIFVRKSDVIKTLKLMNSYGYELYPHVSIENSLYMKLDSEYRFKSNSGTLIEINWNFSGNYFPLTNNRVLFDNIQLYKINNEIQVSVPSQINHFLMLCIHCAKHDWDRLSWICDISEFIQNETINWEETILLAKELGVKRILLINISLANNLFGLKVPELLWPHIKEDPIVLPLSIEIKNRIFGRTSFSLINRLFFNLKIRENKMDGLKSIINGFVKPSIVDYEKIRLPEYLFFFYVFIRPFLLIIRYTLI
ncbi:MAG: nucleotidyltransferase family protein [Methanobacterium sp.]|nr:nucleotidyltransferase family protein [Methanobacterium sp.]